MAFVEPSRGRDTWHARGAARGNGQRDAAASVGTELPLADAAQAHRKVLEPGAFGKIVLIP